MSRRRKGGAPIHGWLPIDKPAGMGSTQVVAAVRRITGAAKAGHGGALDPFAEGLLPVALGEATKTLSMVLEGDKRYRCWIRFGAETDSGDIDGNVTESDGKWPQENALAEALSGFLGLSEQVPPIYSAIRIDGERAYKKARRGEAVTMPPRPVRIDRLALEAYADGVAEVSVDCGKGTYMRALARDLARRLGCFGHLTRLKRLGTLGFSIQEAITLERLREAVAQERLDELLLPVDRALVDIPALRLQEDAWRRFHNGQAVRVRAMDCPSGQVRILTPEGRFAAIGSLSEGGDGEGLRHLAPKRLFHTA